ncbi:MAG TPA: RDD family protein [Spongiibacteraceae bacterium]|nr:RDD family protein [Spongiibacteraceae bacterium]
MPSALDTPASSHTTPPPALSSAGPIARLAALGYDSFLIFGLLVVPLFILTGLRQHSIGLQTDGVIHELPPIAPRWAMLLYMIGMIVGFYYYFWRRNGQTLGMQAWRLRLDNISGGRPSFRQCLIRLAVGFFSLLCAGLGYWWIWLDRDRLAWHDRASNTRVIVIPKKPKPKNKREK